MSDIIPIVPLSGSISKKEALAGTISSKGGLEGGLSRDITHKSYNPLVDKPQINSVELKGNKTFEDLGFTAITPQDIDNIIFGGND